LVQAKYLARLIFEAFNRGFARVFLGAITDRSDDEQAMDDQRIVHFGAVASDFVLNDGLTRFEGTPKPSFTGTSNLVAILADPGAAFATGSLTYRIDGAPETLHHTLLQKRDGTFFLALWLEIPSTDAKVALPIIVRFPSAVAQVTTLVPQESSGPINQLKEVSALALDVSDQVTLVQIAPYLPAGNNLCDRSRWKASASVLGDGKGPAAALDGNLTTRWDTLRLQAGMDWFQVDFGAQVRLTNITLNNTQAYPADYPGGYEVYGSVDGAIFDVLPFSVGAGSINATVIDFPQRLLRAVRINQVGTTNNIHWWGIGEFQTTCSM
jgi:F5/8 type C domain